MKIIRCELYTMEKPLLFNEIDVYIRLSKSIKRKKVREMWPGTSNVSRHAIVIEKDKNGE